MLGIETEKLQKTYQSGGESVAAVLGVDLRVKQGEIYALLGPNGAGKTTTISMLTTLLLPTGGWARVAGFDVVNDAPEVRRRIGVTFQELILDQELTGRQALEFHGQLYGMDKKRRRARIEELSALVELDAALDRKTARYSGGMKRRLELARGLLTEPQVLFLDEPTQGLDPQNRASIWGYLQKMRDESGVTLLLTTHAMEEAELLADRVGIIDGGRLVVEGAPGELTSSMGADVITLSGVGNGAGFAQAVEGQSFVQHVTRQQSVRGESQPGEEGAQQVLQIGVDNGNRRLAEMIAAAAAVDFHINEVSVARPSLADVFLACTGRHLRDV